MILVTGATGKIGTQLIRQLPTRIFRARALVRNPRKAALFHRLGLETCLGDMAVPDSLPPALKEISVVFLLSAVGPEQVALQGNLIRASKEAGVQHIVKISAPGADPSASIGIRRWHGEIEALLKKSGLPHTLLRPAYFMQNFLEFSKVIRKKGLFSVPAGDAPVNMVDVRDVATVAAAVLTENGHEGKDYSITGPEALTFSEAAKTLTQAVGKPVAYQDIQPEEYRKLLVKANKPDWLIGSLLGIFSALRNGQATRILSTVTEIGKRRPRTFADFADDYASYFSNSASETGK